MKQYNSLFAHDIRGLLEFRLSVGMKNVTHECYLKHFDDYCCGNRPTATDLTKELVFSWLDFEASERGNRTNSRYSVIRSFGQYRNALGIPSYEVPEEMIPRKSFPRPLILNDDEMTRLYHASDTLSDSRYHPWIVRMCPVLFRLIYTCGLRPGEGIRLKKSQIDETTGTIKLVETKHGKERQVAMSEEMLRVYREYSAQRDAVMPDAEFAFPDETGGKFGHGRAARVFRSCWLRANPGKTRSELPAIKLYDLRHRFASAVLQKWLDEKQPIMAKLPYLRAYMGHKAISSTLYYVHILPKNLFETEGIDWSEVNKAIPED